MSKEVTAYKVVQVRVPASYKYTCDTCGYEFKKGERKVTYHNGKGKMHACYKRPCSPFSEPDGYERVWDASTRDYEWVKL